MSKTVTVQARIEPDLKRKVDMILKKVGITPSQAVNALYAQIALRKSLPFELKIPNKKTLAAIRELEVGKGKMVNSFQELLDDLDS